MKRDDKGELLDLHVKLLARVDSLLARVDALEARIKRIDKVLR